MNISISISHCMCLAMQLKSKKQLFFFFTNVLLLATACIMHDFVQAILKVSTLFVLGYFKEKAGKDKEGGCEASDFLSAPPNYPFKCCDRHTLPSSLERDSTRTLRLYVSFSQKFPFYSFCLSVARTSLVESFVICGLVVCYSLC